MAQVVYELRNKYRLKDLLAYAGIPASTYYYYVNYHHKDKDRKINELIQSIYDEYKGRYGYRRVLLVLRNDHHYVINHKKVQKLMRELGLKGRIRKSKYRSYKGTVGKICPNYLNRDFNTTKANQKWVTDVSEFKLGEDKLYLSPILDLHGGYIVSYDLSSSLNLYQTRVC
ncbi:IS3 family transposase [Mycoplasmatota bacterium]|nr:IS3 family transposase [Mycoplasmatota bacterium]